MKNRQKFRCQESGRGMEARKTEIAMEQRIKGSLERVGEEWEKSIDKRNCRLQTENVVRER